MKWKSTMNDEFFKQFYEEPRPEFAEALYERIARETQPRFAGILPQKLTFRNAVIALAFLFFIAACVYAVSEKRWDKVGSIWVHVERTIKVKVDVPSVSGEPLVIESSPECFRVEEAREMLRFRFKVPVWAPDGFTFSDEICSHEDLSLSFSSPYLIWEGADKNAHMILDLINLKQLNSATQKYEVGSASTLMYGMSVPPGSYEEVQVHGQPAVLVRGDWNWEEAPWASGEPYVGEYEYKWDQKRALHLYWVDGDVFYHLYTRAKVSSEDLIRMAESAQ
jgi:hypothetical protein